MNSVDSRALSAAARDGILCQAREAYVLEMLITEFRDFLQQSVDMSGVTEFTTTSTLAMPIRSISPLTDFH
jgi:hypothetical protein